MYVILEWNQASHQPTVVGDIYDTVGEAQYAREWWLAELAKTGRRERYTIHEISDEEEE